MLERLVSRLVSNQVAGLKRRISGLSLIAFALLLLALAAVFAFLALHLWLSAIIEPWQAALTVAGLVVLIATGEFEILARVRFQEAVISRD